MKYTAEYRNHETAAPFAVNGKPVLASFNCTESYGDQYAVVVNERANAHHPHGGGLNPFDSYTVLLVEPVDATTVSVAVALTAASWRTAVLVAAAQAHPAP